MSSYLSHLVGRTLGMAATLTPAAGNPFEPAPLVETPDAQGAVLGEGQEGTFVPAPESAAWPAKRVSTPAREDSAGVVPLQLDAVLAQAPAAAAPTSALTPPGLPAAGHPETTESPERPMPRDERIRIEPVERPPEPVPRHVPASREGQGTILEDSAHATHAPRPGPVAIPVPARPNTLTTTLAAGREASPRVTDLPAIRAPRAMRVKDMATPAAIRGPSPQRGPEVPPKAAARAAPLAPLLRATPPLASESSRAKPAPDVHITIGCVEIRALTAPPRNQPAAAPVPRALRPSLSLADYLTRRGGKR